LNVLPAARLINHSPLDLKKGTNMASTENVDTIVLLDNKRIAADIHDLDVDQGWVDIYDVPPVSKIIANSDSDVLDLSDPEPIDHLPIRRLYGKVEIKYVKYRE